MIVILREEAMIFDSEFKIVQRANFRKLNQFDFDVYCGVFKPEHTGDEFIVSFWAYNRFDQQNLSAN